ncbi:MAG: fibronectin type III domain-containing protein, partial [Spirochaetales bacterium]|nr:fibronectin type III domain-containing protein [Spirochaetales bacterium]
MNIFRRLILICFLAFIFVLSCKPEIPLFAPGLEDNLLFNTSTPTISWDVPYGAAGFEYRIDGGEWKRVAVTVTSYTFDISLADGVYSFDVRVVNAEGVPSDSHTSIKFTIDTSSVGVPTPSGVSPTNNVKPVISWEAVEDAVAYRVRIDGGQWILLNSP